MEDEYFSLLVSDLESANVHLDYLFVLQLLILLSFENSSAIFFDKYLIFFLFSALLDSLIFLTVEFFLNLASYVDDLAIFDNLLWQLIEELSFRGRLEILVFI